MGWFPKKSGTDLKSTEKIIHVVAEVFSGLKSISGRKVFLETALI